MPSGEFVWKKGPRRAGRSRLCVSFAPTRTRLLSVSASKSSEQLVARSSALWSGEVADARAPLRLAIEWEGERPELTNVATRLVDGRGDDDSEFLTVAARRYLRLLESRAARRFSSHAGERRFFLRFDAWTNVSIVTWLHDPAFRSKLSARARALFVGPGLEAFPFRGNAQLLHGIAAFLMGSARSRAEGLMGGSREEPSLEDAIYELPPGIESRDASFRELATYLDAIFWRHGPARGKSRPATVKELERAFALFASGALAFVRAAETKPHRASLNAEPDSAYFFLFAELALRAARMASGSEADRWRQLARIFVALEDVFVATYGPELGKRDLDDRYLRKDRSKRVPLPLKEVLAHIALFGRARRGVDLLDKLTLIHEINLLHAGRDEMTSKYSFGTPPPPAGEDEGDPDGGDEGIDEPEGEKEDEAGG